MDQRPKLSTHYMPPEQVTGAEPAPAADQYALGCMIYAMLTGRTPFQSDDVMNIVMMHMRDPAPSLREFKDSISVSVDEVVLRTLRKNPEDRYPDLEALLTAFEEALVNPDRRETPLQDEPTPSPPSKAPEMPQVEDSEATVACDADDTIVGLELD